MENKVFQINEAIVRDICYGNFKCYPTMIERFQTGNCHFVYKIIYPTRTYVLRISSEENKVLLQASLYWLDKLCVYDIPVPKILIDGTGSIYPYVFLTYIEGVDLGDAYTQLSDDEKRQIIGQLIGVQKSMDKLPKHRGFGYLSSYEDDNYKNSWKRSNHRTP